MQKINENEELVLDLDEEIASMVAETGFEEEKVVQYMEAEEQYLMEKGIIMWPGVNCTQEELDEYLTNPERDQIDLDCDDMVDYIARKTGLSLKEANKLLDAEYHYEHSIGLAGDIQVSYETKTAEN